MTLLGTSKISVNVAAGKIDEICQAVNTHRQQLTSFGFSRGYLGVSVFNYLYAMHSGKEEFLDEARQTFDQACDMIDSDLHKTYPQDFAELGIVTQYLHKAGVLDLDPNTFLDDVDTILLQKMRYELSIKNIGGFVNGALGYGLYFLHRCQYNREKAEPAITELINGIMNSAIRTSKGCFWNSRLNPKKENTYLSMPHGSAAILLFMARAVEMNLFPASRLQEIAHETISYMEAHSVQNEYYQFIDIVQDPHKSRLALCYGDLGIGYTLLRAGNAFKNKEWSRKGHAVLQSCSMRRSESTTGVQDASILFGATGLALAFDHISQLMNDTMFKETAGFWYSEILRLDGSADGYAGYKAAYNQWHSHTNLAFSEGIIGIGCGLIKGLHSSKVNFDELIWLL
ncbi:lanthionine synthetase LanC family protein [Dyadobacter sediminis]|nr:lanthionine synthetase LanC family protein [Dyadobacter sediminis]GGC05434.1 hypothetical protein GCM10011325_35400 [Dyadobacter sediminis]